MAVRTWHPYAPDQAFGRQAAQDEEVVDQILDRLDRRDRAVPRAGNKAAPSAPSATTWQPRGAQLEWLVAHVTDGPSTTATALDAAPHVRGRAL